MSGREKELECTAASLDPVIRQRAEDAGIEIPSIDIATFHDILLWRKFRNWFSTTKDVFVYIYI